MMVGLGGNIRLLGLSERVTVHIGVSKWDGEGNLICGRYLRGNNFKVDVSSISVVPSKLAIPPTPVFPMLQGLIHERKTHPVQLPPPFFR